MDRIHSFLLLIVSLEDAQKTGRHIYPIMSESSFITVCTYNSISISVNIIFTRYEVFIRAISGISETGCRRFLHVPSAAVCRPSPWFHCSPICNYRLLLHPAILMTRKFPCFFPIVSVSLSVVLLSPGRVNASGADSAPDVL